MRQKMDTKRRILLKLALCAPMLLGACGGGQTDTTNTATANASNSATPAATPQATPQTPPVTATVEEVKLDAGGTAEATITLDIAQGYHVHSNPAADKFYIATEVKAEPREGLTPGTPIYPKPVTHKFEFSDKPLTVYEGRALIKLPLRADKTATKGQHTLNANIRVQPCNDQTCLPPRGINAAIPVVVN